MQDIIGDFISQKDADSDYIKLEDGESIEVKELRNIEQVTTTGYNGEQKLTLRFHFLVDTVKGERVKFFDNSSKKFAEEIRKKKVQIGSSFTLIRNGVQQKTVYFINNVKEAVAQTPVPAQTAPVSQSDLGQSIPVQAPAPVDSNLPPFGN